jgi:hypothetical protein
MTDHFQRIKKSLYILYLNIKTPLLLLKTLTDLVCVSLVTLVSLVKKEKTFRQVIALA